MKKLKRSGTQGEISKETNQKWIFIQREFVYGENIFLTPE